MFNRKKAVYIEKMNYIKEVTVTDDKVKFNIAWSDVKLDPEDVPKILSDLIQIYALVRDSLAEKSENINADKKEEDEPINLDDIPF